VLLENGKYGIIKRVTLQQLEILETTYNFEVEDYVGNDGIFPRNTGDCGVIDQSIPDDYVSTYKNGLFESNPKHGSIQKRYISRGLPHEYGQYALDNAIPFKNGKSLYAYNGKEIIQFMPHREGVYHGFITNIQGINSSKARNWLMHKYRI